MMTYRALALTSTVAALLLSNPSWAQEVLTQANQLTYNGLVQPGCIMAVATTQSAQNASMTSPAPGAADVVVTQLVGDDAVPVGAQITLTMEAACNQAHILRVSSQNGALVNSASSGAVGPFRDDLPYSIVVAWANAPLSFGSADGLQTQSVNDAARGSITLMIQVPAGGSPMVAGSYSDQLVLELGVAG